MHFGSYFKDPHNQQKNLHQIRNDIEKHQELVELITGKGLSKRRLSVMLNDMRHQ